jgi:2-polyprenyl-3-methyl-5-hydroxy-6-metoxy-1,4-benzoquinol methylase
LSSPYLDKSDRWSSHSRIVSWLKLLPKGSIVLDVGTATGTIGRYSSDLGLYLKGVEPNIQWAMAASGHYDELVACTVEEAENDYISGADVVVLADVLEHLENPNNVLKRLVGLQKADCGFIISVPNIANIWIRLNLLIGKFDYTDRGILDRTHLHFYTRKTFRELLEHCGLDVKSIDVTPIPINIISPFFQLHPFGRFVHFLLAKITEISPTLFGYQFVALAVPKNP